MLTQHLSPGDVRVAQSLRDQLQHVEFTRRQHRQGCAGCGSAPRLLGRGVLAPERRQYLRQIQGAARGVSSVEGLSAQRGAQPLTIEASQPGF